MCEARFFAGDTCSGRGPGQIHTEGLRKELPIRVVFCPNIALPATRPSRCLHTNQLATEEALLGICHRSIAGMRSAGVRGLDVSGCGDRVGAIGSGGRNGVTVLG